MTQPIIRIKDVNFKYVQEYILHGMNLEINQGEFYIIIGPRGEGKSTFLKLMAGLLRLEQGDIFYGAVNLRTALKSEIMAVHCKTAFMFQDAALISNMKLEDNIALPLRYNAVYPEEDIIKKVSEKLGQVDLKNRMSVLPAFLSMGQRKLAALIRAVIVKPETIFYDEPLANLDKPSQGLVKKIMKEAHDNNVTSLVVTHQVPQFTELAQKVIVLKDKTLYTIDTMKNITNSRDPFIKGLTG